MNNGVFCIVCVALITQCQAGINIRHCNTGADINCIDSLVIIYDPEICPGEVEKYKAQSVKELLSNDYPMIIEKDDSVITSFFNDMNKAQNSSITYIDTDLAAFIYKRNNIDTLVLGKSPDSMCDLNSEHVYCPEAYLDIVEIVMRNDEEWRRRYVDGLKVLLDYYNDSTELESLLCERIRKMISFYE
ncbi:MAG: hypothetical protein KBT08_10710 [Bacteroidales bacterium]|nr:hypothetical protein [Candidatus Cryptobacteroides onthequi]